jgi:hypothetical protein
VEDVRSKVTRVDIALSGPASDAARQVITTVRVGILLSVCKVVLSWPLLYQMHISLIQKSLKMHLMAVGNTRCSVWIL